MTLIMKLFLEASGNLLIETNKAIIFTTLLLSYFYFEHVLFTEHQIKFKVVPKNLQFLSASYDPAPSQSF